MNAAAVAALRLAGARESFARWVTDRMYEERPDLLARYGERGRDKCLQDLRYTIDHLVPAVELEDPALFTSYVRWLDELLRARNVDTVHTVRSLELLAEAADAMLPPDEAEVARRILEAGVAQLAREGA